MSIPLEHKLVQTPEGLRLTRMPVKELDVLRNKTYQFGKLSLKENSHNPLKDVTIELAELRMELTPGKASEVVLNIRGVELVYDVANKALMVDGVKAPAALMNGKLKLVIYADRTGLEIFINNGLTFMPININLADNNRSLSLHAKGGTVTVNNLDVYELKSIWE
jgi:sucrose-6-phosphate hydrolase SacC (GH32 family)